MLRTTAFLALLIPLPAIAGSAPAPDVSRNPHVVFLKAWLNKPGGAHPAPAIRFRFAGRLNDALRDQDRPLVRELVPLYERALASEIQMLGFEFSARSRQAELARQMADQLRSLAGRMAERPAAGMPGRLERETLEAAAVPFGVETAGCLAKLAPLARRLELLGARPEAAGIPDPEPPASADAAALADASPVRRVLDLLAERRFAALEMPDPSPPDIAPVFVDGDSLPVNIVTRHAVPDRFSSKTLEDMRRDDRAALVEAIQRRLDAIAALQPLVQAFPQEKIARMMEAADLAERQYRQGAIPLGLFLETQKAVFEAHRARTDALLDLWRETMELRSLTGG